MTTHVEYKLHFVRQQNGPRRQAQHGNITLHGVLEKRTPNGRVLDKTPLGSIDLEALEFDLVKERDEFWRVTDLYLNLFDVPREAADEICEYLSQIVRPITENEAALCYGSRNHLRETMHPDAWENMRREDRATISVHVQTKAEIDTIGKRGETFDDIIKRLLSCYRERCLGE